MKERIKMNKVIISNARLTRDVEIKQAGATTVGKFGIAVNREYKRDEADFINCVAFGKTAETIAQYLKKGSLINFMGRIQTGKYVNADGKNVNTFDVIIDSFEFPQGNKKQDEGQQSGGFNKGFDDDITPVDDGDNPF